MPSVIAFLGRFTYAQVAELADALASGASGRKVVEVRVLSWAPNRSPVLATEGEFVCTHRKD